MTEDAFSRLAEPLRRHIYRHRWDSLTSLQTQVMKAVMDTEDSMIVSAGTASGKTEAVMFPVLSEIFSHPASGVRVLYISPLKALINDQYRRFIEMTEAMDISVLRYHSDIGNEKKKTLRQQDNLILMLTPESLESLLANERTLLKTRMENLQYIVIDEMHYFMESERGIQLLCVLERLQRLLDRIPRRIGLSATIGSAESACNWLRSDTGMPCRILNEGFRKKPYRLMITGYANEAEKIAVIKGLVKDHRSLLFVPTKKELEETAMLLGEVQPVYMHHAGLSTEIRKDTEEQLRKSTRPVTAASTTTLELGIDIGSLERIVQIGAPQRITSMVQRLGRSGRRSQPSEMAIAVNLEADVMHWELLQAIAAIRLYTEEHWMETPQTVRKPFNIMLQQMLAILNSEGSMTELQLKTRICGMESMAGIESLEYDLLYQHMLNEDLLEVAEDGTLMLGMKGEFIVGSREFYTVFSSSDEYQVYHKEQRLGCCSKKPEIGDIMEMAGASWKVLYVDAGSREVSVRKSAEAGRGINGGSQEQMVDQKILMMMLDTLEDTRVYPWLTVRARKALWEDREVYRNVQGSQKRITIGKSLLSGTFKYAAYLPERLMELQMESGSKQERSLLQQISDWKRRWKHGTD